MTLYALDTDTLVLLQQANAAVATRVRTINVIELATTVINVEEQLRGWYSLLRCAKQPPQIAHAYQRLADTVKFTSRFQILPFTESAIERFAALKSRKLGIKHMDLRIAAVVLEHQPVLVTRNIRDFVDVPGLTVEDWSQ